MTHERPDRTVHARLRSGAEIVRYDVSGKWYRESKGFVRQPISVREAARRVIADDWSDIYFDRPGGAVFDRLVKAGLP